MSYELFKRLTPRGKRRAVIVYAVSCAVWIAIMFAVGYLLCALTAGLQMLAGVWG